MILIRFLQITFLIINTMSKRNLNRKTIVVDGIITHCNIDLKQSNEHETVIKYTLDHTSINHCIVMQGVYYIASCKTHTKHNCTSIYCVEMWSYKDLVDRFNNVI